MTYTLATHRIRRRAEGVIERSGDDQKTKRIKAVETPLGFLAVRIESDFEQGRSVKHLTSSGMLFDITQQTVTVFENNLWLPVKHKETPPDEPIKELVHTDPGYLAAPFMKTFDYSPRPITADDIESYAHEHDELRTAHRALRKLRWGHQRQNPLLESNTTARDDLVSIMVAAELNESAGNAPAFPHELRAHFSQEMYAKLGSLTTQLHD